MKISNLKSLVIEYNKEHFGTLSEVLGLRNEENFMEIIIRYSNYMIERICIYDFSTIDRNLIYSYSGPSRFGP